MVIGYAAYNTTINIYGNGKLAENLSDFKVYLSNLKVNGKEVSGINNTKDEFTINDLENAVIDYEITNDSTEYDTESYLECDIDNTWDFDYTGGEQTFTVPTTGTYKLETWGAQGGSINETYYGGYGAYSSGEINIKNRDILYINVGGSGQKFTYPSSVDASVANEIKAYGGYNGGGNGLGYWTSSPGAKQFNTSGGGVTHIAKTSGLLSTLEAQKNKIFIVASGGGGAQYFTINELYSYCIGASGGGITGTIKYCDSNFTSNYLKNVTNATQLSGGKSTYNNSSPVVGSFGQGGAAYTGGGGGFYGGSSNGGISASGSGYIGNSELSEKVMYCYNCQESSEESTKTISTTCTSATPTVNCSKQGNGYARITLISY